ncbi:T9SS type A sorting domain-containing protein [Empedobacter stercoris]|uniref:T9SS type A sorting domain-containing protein n=1 Tax=Empedobacter stercoris TaxID=1628248 RepID=UPI001CE104FC|nr:T9SS type A sorting domain-containing protein [Empedobacter stercoris]MCA4778031.1 T9SS type A sorting domain-containing protein [Empedobacter stercoris]
MKNFLFSVATIFATNFAFSQIVNEEVNFDNFISSSNNDLSQRFIFGAYSTPNFISQINYGGITGGALVPPNSVTLNDFILYCSTYKNVIDNVMETSISFKYNSALINPNSHNNILEISLRGDLYQYPVAFNLDKNFLRINVFNNYMPPKNLQNLIDGHWYKVVTQYKPIGGSFGDQAFVKVEIFDTGMTGNTNPQSIGSLEGNVYDVQLITKSTYFGVRLTATKWGGAEYLDNFIFSGDKFSNYCGQMSITESKEKNKLSIFPIPANKILNIINPKNGANKIEIFDINGKLVLNKNFANSENKISIDVENLPKGIYIYKVGELSTKFIKN